jgi:hypothetical protein
MEQAIAFPCEEIGGIFIQCIEWFDPLLCMQWNKIAGINLC